MRSATASGPGASIRHVIERGRPLAWTGRGVSLALAEAFAASCRALGLVAFAVGAADLNPEVATAWSVCSVSRSGWTPFSGAALLVTEEPGHPGADADDALVVRNCGEPATAWFPLGFAREAVRAFAEAAEIVLPVVPALEVLAERKNIVLFSSSAAAASRLVTAAEHKLGSLGVAVAEVDEFGHGLHSRVAVSPSDHAVQVICREVDRVPALAAWCDEVGIPLRIARVPATAPAFPLVGLLAVLDAVRLICTAHRLDLGERPLPDHLDHLRDCRSPQGGALCA